MNDMMITSPTLNDVDTLWKWGEENWELWGDPETKWFSKVSLREWIENPRDDVLLVARVDGVLAGVCFTNNLRSWAYCAGLFVDKPYRTRGIARKLVDESMNRLKAMNVESIAFLVDQKNTKGLEFYKKISCKTGCEFTWMYKTF